MTEKRYNILLTADQCDLVHRTLLWVADRCQVNSGDTVGATSNFALAHTRDRLRELAPAFDVKAKPNG